ncbi:IucA/IucC family protein [Streptomyces hainanensis]|uniref:Iron transporter n=1 Tax=Streptomyces hainanensis TaxID=402648 RepID=A0A4R4T808_9ACTN|nr:IucA/IucC family protein [Streptomyces hainanensis]TDC73147.1 iron transporter [Streptomyces hainanensis]
MNGRPRPDRSPGRERQPVRRRPARLMEPSIPRQPRGDRSQSTEQDAATPREVPDPLEHPLAEAAADAATVESLLRCWVRETGAVRPAGGTLLLPLASSGVALRVRLRYWSATGWHRFGPVRIEGAPPTAAPVDAVTLAALLGREAAHRGGAAQAGAEGTAMVGRVADSVRRTAGFLAARRLAPGPSGHGHAFLDAEQSLLLGHPLHPTPKSREGLAGHESRRASPELRGSFPLHWMAVDRSVLAADSAWTERGETVPAEALAARLAGSGLTLPPNTVPLPLHPWQARDLVHRPPVAALLGAGLLHDLGEHGEPWYPTSSVRTVHRPGAPAMLKLSLALRITNSRRENLRKELHRGVEVHRLLSSGLGAQWRAAFPAGPGFDIVRDPAWLAVDDAQGRPVPGLDTVLRHNPFGPRDDALCLAALTGLRPWPGRPEAELRSRLADVVRAIAERTGRGTPAVSAEWLLRYLRAVVRPLLWLDAWAGVALEAHQQNTLVLLDAEGWPAGGRFRDNQGYYFRASHREALDRRLPGIGQRSDTFVADEVADERFAYYLGINNVLGLIGGFGAQGLADEGLLLAAFRRFLTEEAGAASGGPVSPLVAHLLESATLRCKANMLTRLHGLDELVGPVDGQSVYVTVPNPLATA